ncbi:MAG: saccharopine dehydrogenase NADP-binding domain-containing protein [Chloroflexota bacterium]
MKVLILGGCGYIGSSTARDLVKAQTISKVRLADIDPRLERVHTSLRNNPKVSAEYIDITRDFAALVKLIKGHDLVLNCVGPYSQFGLTAARAAIKAHVNYADVCDDLEMTRRLFGLDGPASKAGVCLCTGLGSVPGITNILASYGAGKMDSVDEIEVHFLIALMDPIGKAGLTQAIGQFVGEVWQFLDGRLVRVPAGSEPQTVTFLEPFGKTDVYFARHPEPFTFPRFIPGVKRVINKAAFYPASTVKLFTEILRLGLFDDEPLKAGDGKISPRDFIVSFLQRRPDLRSQPGLKASLALNVTLHGRKDRANAVLTYRSVGWGGRMTAIPASTGVQMLLEGKVKAKGVVAPEGAFDPAEFLRRMASRGIWTFEESTLMQEVRA